MHVPGVHCAELAVLVWGGVSASWGSCCSGCNELHRPVCYAVAAVAVLG